MTARKDEIDAIVDDFAAEGFYWVRSNIPNMPNEWEVARYFDGQWFRINRVGPHEGPGHYFSIGRKIEPPDQTERGVSYTEFKAPKVT